MSVTVPPELIRIIIAAVAVAAWVGLNGLVIGLYRT